MKKINNFADKVIAKKNKSITDEVFLLIQNDKELMHEYLRLVEENGLDAVNKSIGKRVKNKYGLKNEDRNNDPESTLISSYQQFE